MRTIEEIGKDLEEATAMLEYQVKIGGQKSPLEFVIDGLRVQLAEAKEAQEHIETKIIKCTRCGNWRDPQCVAKKDLCEKCQEQHDMKTSRIDVIGQNGGDGEHYDVEVNRDGWSAEIGEDGFPIDDPVNHPSHYTRHPSGVQCIAITEEFSFCIGNAIKYLWRAGLKGDNEIQDLEKAAWYIQREIARLKK